MALAFGQIVLVPFPFTNQSGTKKRPAAIVSTAGYNTSRRDLIIMAITSQVRQPVGFGEAVIADWESAGLLKPSVTKPVLATIEQGLVLRTLGTLSESDLRALRKVIAQTIG
jgi:mRNA interferase MazF